MATVLGLSLGTTSTASATYYETSKLTAFKFNDLNANGQYDEGEPPLAGWEFCLLKENGDPYPKSWNQYCETTNSYGFATFSNLPVGLKLKIVETVKPGWTVTTPNPQGDTVESGSFKGEPCPNPATIGGFEIHVSNPAPDTWEYTVPSNNGGKGGGLSHWVLGIGTVATTWCPTRPQAASKILNSNRSHTNTASSGNRLRWRNQPQVHYRARRPLSRRHGAGCY